MVPAVTIAGAAPDPEHRCTSSPKVRQVAAAEAAAGRRHPEDTNAHFIHSRHRTHSTAFKRQVVQEYLAGETLHALGKRHDLSRNLIRIWLQKHQAGAFDEEAVAADTVQEYEARIAALERLVGKQATELEFLKGALKNAPRARSGSTSVITGPTVSPSQKDAN